MAANEPTMHRRSVLAASAALAGTAVAPTVAGQSESGDDLGSFFEDVDNYDGVVDRTGSDEVRVEVGAGDGFQFGPAAIRVEAGTTVVWEWTGEGGAHNVVEQDGAFESERTDEEGHTFEQTFEAVGTHRYVCEPHVPAGMKGAVVVSPPDPTPAVEEHLSDVDTYDGIVDERGSEEVRVAVGSDDGFRFDPPAVRVDPGTTVVWEWTGEGGAHDVAEVDGAFQSEQTDEADHTYEQTFDEPGHHLYVCTPHEAAGMKGTVVVGDAGADGASGVGAGIDPLTLGGVAGVLLAPLAAAVWLLFRDLRDRSPGTDRRPRELAREGSRR